MLIEIIYVSIYVYLRYVLPTLLAIAIFLVLIGMTIKIGLKAGQAVFIVVGTAILFSYVLYGNKALDVFKKIYKKFASFFFYPLTNMLKKGNQEEEDEEDSNE